MALWHMGSGTHPALMMELPTARRSRSESCDIYCQKTLQSLQPPSLNESCGCVGAAGTDEGWRGGGIIHLQPGWDAGCGSLPVFSLQHPAGREGLGHIRLSLPLLRGSRGARRQQQSPEVLTTRPGHRCSNLVPCGDSWRIPSSPMPVALQVLATITSRCSGQVRH